MRLTIALLFVIAFTGLAAAAPDGLERALDRQQQDLKTQQAERQRRVDGQGQQLQQQQEQTLRFELLQRNQMFQPNLLLQPPRPLTCTQVGVTLVCR